MTVTRWTQPELAPVVGRDVVDGWAHQVQAVAALAARIAGTDFVPKGYRGSDAAVTAAILAGRETGIGPMTALQHLHVVDGRPAMSAQLMRALVFAHGHRVRVVESTAASCTMAGTRAGDTGESAVTWTMEDARRAGLTGKPNWSRYPRQMLLARVTGELCRVLFPDVIGGMAYTVEEAADIPADDNGAPPPTRTIRRKAPANTPHPEPAPSSTAGPVTGGGPTGPGSPPPGAPRPPGASTLPAGGDPPPFPDDNPPPPPPVVGWGAEGPGGPRPPTGPENGPVAAGPAPGAPEPTEPANDAERGMTAPQRRHLFELLGQLGVTVPRAARLRVVSGLAGRRLTSVNQLTRAAWESLSAAQRDLIRRRRMAVVEALAADHEHRYRHHADELT